MKIGNIVRSDKFTAWVLLVPASLVLMIIRLIPMIQGIGYSFTNKRMLNAAPAKFMGVDNFIRLFQDTLYWQVVGFTLIFSVSVVILAYVCGLLVAVLMNLQIKVGRGVFRSILMIPWVIPTVVAAYVWRYAFNDQIGIFNIILQALGLTTKPVTFLSSPLSAQISVIITSAWKNTPFMALILLAGLQNVGEDVKEAARIDGANGWQTFIRVIFPQLNLVTAMGTILIFVQSFNSFDIVYMLTNGGPGKSTLILSVLGYQTAFEKFSTSYGATMASVMLVFMLIFSFFYLKLMRGKDNE